MKMSKQIESHPVTHFMSTLKSFTPKGVPEIHSAVCAVVNAFMMTKKRDEFVAKVASFAKDNREALDRPVFVYGSPQALSFMERDEEGKSLSVDFLNKDGKRVVWIPLGDIYTHLAVEQGLRQGVRFLESVFKMLVSLDPSLNKNLSEIQLWLGSLPEVEAPQQDFAGVGSLIGELTGGKLDAAGLAEQFKGLMGAMAPRAALPPASAAQEQPPSL